MRPPIRRIIFDLHGLLLDPVEGLVRSPGEVIAALREAGLQLAFVTNSSSMSAADIVDLQASLIVGESAEVDVALGAAVGAATALLTGTPAAGPRRAPILCSGGSTT